MQSCNILSFLFFNNIKITICFATLKLIPKSFMNENLTFAFIYSRKSIWGCNLWIVEIHIKHKSSTNLLNFHDNRCSAGNLLRLSSKRKPILNCVPERVILFVLLFPRVILCTPVRTGDGVETRSKNLLFGVATTTSDCLYSISWCICFHYSNGFRITQFIAIVSGPFNYRLY